MFISSVLDTTAIDEKQVQSFFSKLTLEKLLYAAVLLVLCAVLIKLILKAADKLFSHSKLDHTIFGFLRTTAKAVLIFIAVMLVAGTLGIDTSSLLAILSVAGLAVSLSMQTALSNVAGALMILTAKPFRSGDYVQIGDKAGTVLTIGAVYTSLRTYDNQIIYLPNSQITTGRAQSASPAAKPAAHCPSGANCFFASASVSAASGRALLARSRNAAIVQTPISSAGANRRFVQSGRRNTRSAAYAPKSVGRLAYSSVRLPPPTSEAISAR